MKKVTSLRVKITIWYSLLMLLFVVVICLVVGITSYRLSKESVQRSLESCVANAMDEMRRERTDPELFLREHEEESGLMNLSFYRENGEYIGGKYINGMSGLSFSNEQLRIEELHGEKYMVYDMFEAPPPVGSGEGYWVRGIESIGYMTILGSWFTFVFLIAIPLILVFSLGGGYQITTRVFAPLNEITKTAKEIYNQEDVKKRILLKPDVPKDELYELALTLNCMLDKIEHLLEQEKQFTSDASHELRTPISVILAQGEYLLSIAEGEKERELAADIVLMAKRTSRLLSELLLLARADNNRQQLQLERIDLGILTEVALSSMKDLIKKRNIEVQTRLQEGVLVYVDEALMLSAVSNLLHNAVKYGKESGHIRISVENTRQGAEIVVEDDGIGISEEHIDKVWGRFYRVDAVRNDEFGSGGLGLPMVQSIVHLHGGAVFVKSRLGEGTQFKILLKEEAE